MFETKFCDLMSPCKFIWIHWSCYYFITLNIHVAVHELIFV